MARSLPFHDRRLCIDCGEKHKRAAGSWRCWPCEGSLAAVRADAQRAVRAAIGAGELPPPNVLLCVDCEAQARDYDHRDYLRPLDVVPVCRTCNQRRGPAAWSRPVLDVSKAVAP